MQKKDSINLLDTLAVLLKWKRLVLTVTLSCALLAAIISLLLPTIYRAETVILPSQKGTTSLAELLFSRPGQEGILASLKSTNDLYIGLLSSRVVLDRIIDRFNLLTVYNSKYRQDARLSLQRNLSIDNDKKSNLVTIRVDNQSPQTAADLANAFVEELKNLTQEIAVTEASQRRLFFEEQLKNTKSALIAAEDSLKGFQEKTGTIEIKEQAKSAIESIAKLRAGIAAKEIQRKVLMTHVTKRNPDLQNLDEELKGMKEQLVKLEGSGGTNSGPQMNAGRMPATGTDYARRLRDLKYHESLFELLAKQYEIAKIDETRDGSTIQVIYKAIPPEKRVKPKRTNLVLIALFGGLFLSVVGVFFTEYLNKVVQDPEVKFKFDALKKLAHFRTRQ